MATVIMATATTVTTRSPNHNPFPLYINSRVFPMRLLFLGDRLGDLLDGGEGL